MGETLARCDTRPVVLVTGSSTGIGLELAQILAADETRRIVLTARASSLSRLGEAGVVESDRVLLRALDVTSETQRRELVEEVQERWGGVGVLVNNAGIAYRAVVEHVAEHERLEQMDVNFNAPMALARLVLPTMRGRREGKIINLSSVGGMMAMPTMALYSASKFALEGASEALWYEVKPWGIHVTLIEPGFVNGGGVGPHVKLTTNSSAAIATPEAAYYAHYHHMEGFISRTARRVFATPRDVAKRVYAVICARNPPLRVPATLDAHLFSVMRRLLPRRLYHWVLYRSLPSVRQWGRHGDDRGGDRG